MVTATSLADTLPSSIPKLDASGLNWAIFAVRFQDAMEAKGFWGHFDGSKTQPMASPSPVAAPASAEGTAAAATTTPVSDSDLMAAQAQWDKDKLSAKSLLTQKIPDLTLMRIHSKRTIQE